MGSVVKGRGEERAKAEDVVKTEDAEKDEGRRRESQNSWQAELLLIG